MLIPTKYKKVLLIDADEVDIYISERILRKSYFAKEIIVRSNALEALNYLASIRSIPEQWPCLIFLSVGITVIEDIDFLDEFNELYEAMKNHCKIIVLTDGLDPGLSSLEKTLTSTLVKVILNKPISPEALENIRV